MKKKKYYIICLAIVMSLMFSVAAEAAEQTARLKTCLQTDYMYYATTISALNDKQASDKNGFEDNFDDKYVVVLGEIKADSISKNYKSVTLYDKTGKSCTIDTSSIVDTIKGLSVGKKIAIYGKIAVTGIKSDSYEIAAKKIKVSPTEDFETGSYVFYADYAYKGTQVSDLTTDGRVRYYIPKSWKDTYVSAPLTNNGVKGYQYFLNALEPQNQEQPEVFYIFYFENETYLEKVPKDASNGDNKDIEAQIVKNILEQLDDESFKVKITDIDDANGTGMDYYTTPYRAKNGNDYRLEFIFRPDKKGITCMLYLYYPKEGAVRHVQDVAYLIETMQVNNE